MDKYTIYCSEEQTIKALNLDAPIKATFLDIPNRFEYEGCQVEIPTAEQLIGWIEENYSILDIDIYLRTIKLWTFVISLSNGDKTIIGNEYNSRKETTLAAIDAALEYLNNNKK